MSTAPPSHRLFFALWPDEHTRAEMMSRVPSTLPGDARIVIPTNLHITLAFLGAVASMRMPELIHLARGVSFAGCELVFDRYSGWPKPRVAVLLPNRIPAALQDLVTQLNQKLVAKGFHSDTRPYQPHVTLVREVKLSADEQPITPVHWSARNFVLVESLSTASGVVYQVVAQFA